MAVLETSVIRRRGVGGWSGVQLAQPVVAASLCRGPVTNVSPAFA